MVRDDVIALLARFGELLDSADFDAIGELFEDGSLSGPDGRPFARGRTEVTAFFKDNTRLHNGSPRTKHLLSNTVVDETEHGAVIARSSYVVYQSVDGFPLQAIIAGRYLDEMKRDHAGRLRFVDRRFFVDLEGDLTHHLQRPDLARTR
jgi:3-phenylpropionate/cinnamic acid dioxygenase small subunit